MTYTRTLVFGARGTGKSARLQAWAQERNGLFVPSNPHALMTGLVSTVAEEIALGVEQIVGSLISSTGLYRLLQLTLELPTYWQPTPCNFRVGRPSW